MHPLWGRHLQLFRRRRDELNVLALRGRILFTHDRCKLFGGVPSMFDRIIQHPGRVVLRLHGIYLPDRVFCEWGIRMRTVLARNRLPVCWAGIAAAVLLERVDASR